MHDTISKILIYENELNIPAYSSFLYTNKLLGVSTISFQENAATL